MPEMLGMYGHTPHSSMAAAKRVSKQLGSNVKARPQARVLVHTGVWGKYQHNDLLI